jgi:hypothetical protein
LSIDQGVVVLDQVGLELRNALQPGFLAFILWGVRCARDITQYVSIKLRKLERLRSYAGIKGLFSSWADHPAMNHDECPRRDPGINDESAAAPLTPMETAVSAK